MADILLAHGYFLGEDEKEQQIMKPYAPLGLLYLSAWLKRAGNPARLIRKRFDDATIEGLLRSKWWELDEDTLTRKAHLFNDAAAFLRAEGVP